MAQPSVSSGNAGALTLGGWSNGTILDWQTSVNGGATWSPTGVTATTYNYSALTQDTRYQIVIDGGMCVDDTAGFCRCFGAATDCSGYDFPVLISLCITSASGMLNLSGNTGAVLNWESSDDAGATWNVIANTTDQSQTMWD